MKVWFVNWGYSGALKWFLSLFLSLTVHAKHLHVLLLLWSAAVNLFPTRRYLHSRISSNSFVSSIMESLLMSVFCFFPVIFLNDSRTFFHCPLAFWFPVSLLSVVLIAGRKCSLFGLSDRSVSGLLVFILSSVIPGIKGCWVISCSLISAAALLGWPYDGLSAGGGMCSFLSDANAAMLLTFLPFQAPSWVLSSCVSLV